MGKIKEIAIPEFSSVPLHLTDEEIREPLRKVIHQFRNNYSLGVIRSYLHSYLEIGINKNGSHSFLDLRFHSDVLRIIEACYLLPVEPNGANNEANMIERFLGIMAHEVSSQLAGAQMAIETIIGNHELTTFCNRPDIAFYFTSLRAIVSNTSQVLRNMITTVKFNAGQIASDITKEAVSVELFLDECTIPARIYCESLNKELIIKSDVKGKSIITDKVKLSQVIHNLLYNAFAHSIGSSSITLSCHSEKNHTVFSVASKAADLSELDLANIFLEYYQANGNKAGSGIGLYLSKVYTELLNGYINVTSKDGLIIFTVYIPSLVD